MKTLQVWTSGRSAPSKTKRFLPPAFARWIVSTCCATTDRTSSSMRLNSSKHAHAPLAARPCA
eukprot:354987-Chlamydomonas_euryale.AAC.9